MLTSRLLASMRRRARRDAGMTLIEVLVAMTLMGVVGAVVSAGVLSAMQDQRRQTSRLEGLTTSQRALERVAKDVRAANPLVAADANSITVLVYRGGACQQRRYYVDATQRLVQEIAKYTASTTCRSRTGVPGAATTNVLTKNVANPVATPVFGYQRIDPAQAALVAVPTPAAASVVSLVDKVTISLRTGLKHGQNPVVVGTAIDLRNVERNS